MTPLKWAEFAPFSRKIQHFHGLVDRITCMSSFKYMLLIFRILLFSSSNGLDVLSTSDFKGASRLADIF
jgi:hypothetical protein